MCWYSVPNDIDTNKSNINWPIGLMFFSVLMACFLGIWSRPTGFLASVWPANAVMLGILLRFPATAKPLGWLSAAVAFMLADLLTEATFVKAAILNSANLVSVATAYGILSRCPAAITQLRQPQAMLYLTFAAAAGGVAAGAIGGIANPLLFNGSIATGFLLWLVTEVVNYIAILPILLTAPMFSADRQATTERQWHLRRHDVLPAAAVVLSCAVALVVAGEGAVAFPILPLLWCALAYPVFPTAVLTFCCSLFALLVIFDGHFSLHTVNTDETALISIRLGIAVVALSPIMLAIITNNRNELLNRLRFMSSHDPLTGVGNRAAFYAEAEKIFSTHQTNAILMLDLDNFKTINDNYGHAAGDVVLRETAQRISKCLRPADSMARMGGEEFAVILKGCTSNSAITVAERIRESIAGLGFAVAPGQTINVTTSVGIKVTQNTDELNIDTLLAEADHALYRSKTNGRNRVELSE